MYSQDSKDFFLQLLDSRHYVVTYANKTATVNSMRIPKLAEVYEST